MKLTSIKTRFSVVIAVAYILSALLTYAAFHLITQQIIQKLGRDFSVKQAQLNKSKLATLIQHDLVLSRKMSNSPLLVKWAQNEENKELRALAGAELESYRKSFNGQSVSFIIDKSKNQYFYDGVNGYPLDRPVHTLQAENKGDGWYFRNMRETGDFELNVDHDGNLGLTKVWYNVVIRDTGGRKIGIGGSSIDISKFIGDITNVDAKGQESILFSQDGAITGHKNKSYVIDNGMMRESPGKTTILSLFQNKDDQQRLKAAMASLSAGKSEVETLYLTTGHEKYLAAMTYFKDIRWYNLVLVDTSRIVKFQDFMPLLATTIASLFAVLLIVALKLNKGVLTPISRLTESARRLAQGSFEIVLPVEREDEVGALTSTFNDMSRMIKSHTDNLEQLIQERTQSLEAANFELLTINEELMAHRSEAEQHMEALQQSEDQLRLLLDSTAEAIYGTDLDGNCTFCNSSAVRLLGYSSPDQLVGQNMHRMIHHTRPDGTIYPEEECPRFIGLQNKYGVHIDEETLWRADGRHFKAELWSFPQYRNGEIVGTVVTFLDITKRIQAQEKLHKLSRAVENSPATVVITDRFGQIEYVNPKFTETSGYYPEEAIGRNPRILNAGVQSRKFYKELWRTILSGQEWRGEFCNRRKNGSIHWEHASISPIRDDNGTITHFVAVKEDITERKRVAGELEQAKEAADAANRFKSEFLANMSHEIRTPLNAIIGFSALVIDTELSPRQRDFLQKISNAGESLLRIINDILDFSKIEAGKLDMERTSFRVGEALTNALALVQQKAAEKKLQMFVNIAPDVPAWLVGDPLRLGQVIINLVGNAIKFTEKGTVTISVSVRDSGAERICLEFSVQDTGIGLSAQHLAKLFQPFTQADGSTTRKFGGTGLGLSISKRLVEMMGGEIWGESEQGAGSTFSFTAWFGAMSAEELQHAHEEVESGFLDEYQPVYSASDSPPDFTGASILLVEDNEINRQLAIELLKPLGASVEVAVDGLEAVKRIKASKAVSEKTGGARSGAEAAEQGNGAKRPFDLVLMDIQMPEMDGYEATRHIRRDTRFANLPIIAMTAHAMQEERNKIMAIGMNGYITKPVNARDMYRTMALHLGASTSWQPIAREETGTGTQPPLPGIPAIPGLDVQGALERIEGDTELYLWILRAFLQSQEGTPEKILAALDDGDHTLAERIPHTTRGLAGNIGATILQELAAKLETAIRNNAPDRIIRGLLQDFTTEHGRLLLALWALFVPQSSETRDSTDETPDPTRIRPVLTELLHLIRENDARACNYLDDHLDKLGGLPRRHLDAVRAGLAVFDYDSGLEALMSLAGNAGISLLPEDEEER